MFGGSWQKQPVPSDALRAEALSRPELLAVAGVPATADALAVEPVQGLVAISTSDGKIKVLGRPGVERTLYSTAKYPYASRQLLFIRNRGVLVRVSKGGFLESWSLASGSKSNGGIRALGTTRVKHDRICCVADMVRDPYVLMGCASGCLRIGMLVDGEGDAPEGPRHVRALEVAPYRVRADELRGSGEVRQLAVQSHGPVHRALVLFTTGCVAVWDLRASELITSVDPSNPYSAGGDPGLADAGEATAVAWIGTRRGDFATGHADGSVRVWALPGLDAGEAEVSSVLRVFHGAAEPVRMLRCVYGEVEGLLVLGGQEVEQPEVLTLLPLPRVVTGDDDRGSEGEGEGGSGDLGGQDEDEEEDEEEGGSEGDEDAEERAAAHARRRRRGRRAREKERGRVSALRLPWFGRIIGFALVAEGGCVTGYEDPAAVLQLVEGGQLVLYHLADQTPHMLAPPFQRRQHVTVSAAPLVPVERPPGATAPTLYLSALRRLAEEAEEEEAEDDPTGMGALGAGTPPQPPADASWGLLYCTGYRDGSVALWDVATGAPRPLCAAPEGDAADPSSLAGPGPGSGAGGGGGGGGGANAGAVSCLELAWPTGLLIAGHTRGEVRMYQFATMERTAECFTLDSVNTPGWSSSLWQPAGLQLRLRVRVQSAEITCLAYCQGIRAVVAGDRSGGVALIDTAKPLVRWYALPAAGQAPMAAAAVAPALLPPPRARNPDLAAEEGGAAHVVVVADAEGCVAALDASRGLFVGRGGGVRPKNHSAPLLLELLDDLHRPLWAARQAGHGAEQAALGGAKKGSRRRQHGGGDAGDESLWADADDVDVDTLLQRAAQQVEGSRGDGSGRASNARGSGRAQQDAPAAAVLPTCPDPPAAHVLLASDHYLRTYPAAGVLTGDRTTSAKRALKAPLLAASCIMVAGAPGVMALAMAEMGLCVQVFSLPSLELLQDSSLSSTLSWFWDLPPAGPSSASSAASLQPTPSGSVAGAHASHGGAAGAAAAGAAAGPGGGGVGGEVTRKRVVRVATSSRLGHLLLLGLGGELLTLGVAAGLRPPPPPGRLFSSKAAAEALEAAVSYEASRGHAAGRLGSRHSVPAPLALPADATEAEGGPGPGPHRSEPSDFLEGVDTPKARTEAQRSVKAPLAGTAAATAAAGKVAGAAKDAGVAFTRVFATVQHGLSRAVEGTTRGVQLLASQVERAQAALIDGAAPALPGDASAAAGVSGGGGGGGGGNVKLGSILPAARASRSADYYNSLPELGAVFSRTVPDDDQDPSLAAFRRKYAGGGGGAGSDEAEEEEEGQRPPRQRPPQQQQQKQQQAAAGARGRGAAYGVKEEEDDDDDVSELSVSDDELPTSSTYTAGRGPQPARAAAPQPSAGAPGGAAARAGGGSSGGVASMRAELFGGARTSGASGGGGGGGGGYSSGGGYGASTSAAAARPGPSGGVSQPRARTAEEIKKAYGRPTTAKASADGVRDVMEQNRNLLAQRGEKLSRLDEKAADLEASAAGFAEMARQIAERERNKKWWQL